MLPIRAFQPAAMSLSAPPSVANSEEGSGLHFLDSKDRFAGLVASFMEKLGRGEQSALLGPSAVLHEGHSTLFTNTGPLQHPSTVLDFCHVSQHEASNAAQYALS